MIRKVLVLLFLAAFAAVPAFSQGSGTVGGGGKNTAFVVTKDLKGTIHELDVEKNFVVIETAEKELIRFELIKKTKLKADKTTELAKSKKKKIEMTDFSKGHYIRVTYDPDRPATAAEVRLLAEKAPEPAIVAGQ